MERYSIDGRLVPTINGGSGSGNFGHSGRPGKVGGSGKGQASSRDFASDDPRDKYKDSEEQLVEDAKDYLMSSYMDADSEFGEDVALAFEDEARKAVGAPTREEEMEGANVSYGEIADYQQKVREMIESSSMEDLVDILGPKGVDAAISYALDKSGADFARENAKLGQGGLSYDDAKKDIRKFIDDFALNDRYNVSTDIETQRISFQQAWDTLAKELEENIEDKYNS